MTTADLVILLKPDYPDLKLESGNHVTIRCPHCVHRGHSEDRTGHLRLHAGKLTGYCVRCGYKIRRGKLHTWLLKKGVNVQITDDLLARAASVTQDANFPVEYRVQTAKLMPNVPILDQSSGVLDSLMDGKHITEEQLERFDVRLVTEGTFKNWAIFPFYEDDVIVYFQLRKWDGQKWFPNDYPLGKGAWLYNIDNADLELNIVLVEGALDVMSVEQEIIDAGMFDDYRVTGIQGSSFSTSESANHLFNTQFGKLKLLNPRKVIVLLDEDARGASDHIATSLGAFFNSCSMPCPKGDPNEFHFASPGKLAKLLASHDSLIPELEL